MNLWLYTVTDKPGQGYFRLKNNKKCDATTDEFIKAIMGDYLKENDWWGIRNLYFDIKIGDKIIIYGVGYGLVGNGTVNDMDDDKKRINIHFDIEESKCLITKKIDRNKIKEYLIKPPGQLVSVVRINPQFEEMLILNENNILESTEAYELFEDNKEFKNELVNRQIEYVKRYQEILRVIKRKYNSKCQISGCNHTFQKSNGEFYSEGHHLVPLSKGGLQNEDNVVILCANHHRMFHYARVHIDERIGLKRKIRINDEDKVIDYK